MTSGKRHACHVSDIENVLRGKVLCILGDHDRWAVLGIDVSAGGALPDDGGVLIGVNPDDLLEARLLLEAATGQ